MLLSAHSEAGYTARRLVLPFLPKPFEVGALLDTVHKYCPAA